MSKKYEHRIDTLKEHKKEKKIGVYRPTKKPANLKSKNLSTQKKAHKDLQKKLEKSNKIW
jgi:hypothetical protein